MQQFNLHLKLNRRKVQLFAYTKAQDCAQNATFKRTHSLKRTTLCTIFQVSTLYKSLVVFVRKLRVLPAKAWNNRLNHMQNALAGFADSANFVEQAQSQTRCASCTPFFKFCEAKLAAVRQIRLFRRLSFCAPDNLASVQKLETQQSL